MVTSADIERLDREIAELWERGPSKYAEERYRLEQERANLVSQKAEGWLRENDPEYNGFRFGPLVPAEHPYYPPSSSKKRSDDWKHLRRGDGLYRPPREREILSSHEGDAEDHFDTADRHTYDFRAACGIDGERLSTSLPGRRNGHFTMKVRGGRRIGRGEAQGQPLHAHDGLDIERLSERLDRERVPRQLRMAPLRESAHRSAVAMLRWQRREKSDLELWVEEAVLLLGNGAKGRQRREIQRFLRGVEKWIRDAKIGIGHRQGRRYEEIAAWAGCSTGTVHNVVQKLKTNLATSREEAMIATEIMTELRRLDDRAEERHHEVLMAMANLKDGETPAEAAERILTEVHTDERD